MLLRKVRPFLSRTFFGDIRLIFQYPTNELRFVPQPGLTYFRYNSFAEIPVDAVAGSEREIGSDFSDAAKTRFDEDAGYTFYATKASPPG
ncbi:MAG: hypothetical protein EXQ91_01005 [Alphaproteobacteria bacterium]|nr:hypothetical protein [Alphaproteobacteria bacterium]